MSQQLTVVAKEVGRIALFCVIWPFTTFGIGIILCFGYASIRFSLAAFGVVPTVPSPVEEVSGIEWYLHATVLVISALVGAYTAFVGVLYTRHKNQEKLERDLEWVARLLWASVQFTLYMVFFSLAISILHVALNNNKSFDFEAMLFEWRWFYLSASIAFAILTFTKSGFEADS